MKSFQCLVIVVFVCVSTYLQACDICNLYMGVNQMDYNSTVNLAWRGQFHSGLLIRKSTATSPRTSQFARPRHLVNLPESFENSDILEDFQVLDIRAKWYFHPKFYVLGNLPYKMSRQFVDGIQYDGAAGIGDPTLMGFYQVFDTKKENQKSRKRLHFGMGSKLPLGSTTARFSDRPVDVDFQPGTGSWDFLSSAIFVHVWKTLGYNIQGNFKANTANLSGYKFGDSVNADANIFYIKTINKNQLISSASVSYQHSTTDDYGNFDVSSTGGQNFFLGAQLNYNIGSFAINGMAQFAVYSKWVGNQLPPQNRFSVGVTYAINKVN